MQIIHTIAELRRFRRQLDGPVALVPTMGALHNGHVSLMQMAQEQAEHLLVSIFVNPTQFGPNEDYKKYPRPLDNDLRLCEQAGAAAVFNPMASQMYPPDQSACAINVPAVAGMLEGEHRPGHLQGVCRVVTKLLNMVQPEIACFGQKDYQQLKVIEAMVADLAMPVKIMACPTLRDSDGLALSSRNVYLSDQQRGRALSLSVALREAARMIEQGAVEPIQVEAAMAMLLKARGVKVDYAVVRHPRTLAKLDVIELAVTGGVVALVAGHVDQVRLIDNMVIQGEATTDRDTAR